MEQHTVRPPRRTAFIDILDGVVRAGRRVGAFAPVKLEKAHLLDKAVRETGLDDFGDAWFERPLEVLLDAVRSEARLNAS